MILAEAFAVGLPVIASNLGSMSSIVDHLRTGLHFEPGNASDLVEKVRWLRAHPAEVRLDAGSGAGKNMRRNIPRKRTTRR